LTLIEKPVNVELRSEEEKQVVSLIGITSSTVVRLATENEIESHGGKLKETWS
jgi:hypothetical protein